MQRAGAGNPAATARLFDRGLARLFSGCAPERPCCVDRSIRTAAVLETVWPTNPGRPEPLSSQRIAVNLELKEAGFDPHDDTLTAIVGPYGSGAGGQNSARNVVASGFDAAGRRRRRFRSGMGRLI